MHTNYLFLGLSLSPSDSIAIIILHPSPGTKWVKDGREMLPNVGGGLARFQRTQDHESIPPFITF